MQNIFIELLPPWVETGLQPAFYDKESGTVLQQVSRMWAKMIELGAGFNKFTQDTAETVNTYIAKFVELYNYVHDYFDNLDVQEEINNKLDAMTEAGTLQEIITTYIQANVAWTFDSVADMKLATNLVDGSYARTLGFYTPGDGGGSIYKISDTGTANEKDVIAVDNLYAILVKEKDVYAEQYGVKAQASFDNKLLIQYALSQNDELHFRDGEYYVSSYFTINSNNSLIGHGTKLYTDEAFIVKGEDLDNVTIEGIEFESTVDTSNTINMSESEVDEHGHTTLSSIINIYNSTNITIKNCKIHGSFTGMFITRCSNVLVEANECYESSSKIVCLSSSQFRLINNYIHDIKVHEDDAYPCYLFQATDTKTVKYQEASVISGNKLINNANWDAIMCHQYNGMVISDNYMANVRSGIDLSLASSESINGNTIIDSNYIEQTTTDRWSGNAAIDHGILIRGTGSDCENVVISNNIIKAFGKFHSALGGCTLNIGNISNITISDNLIYFDTSLDSISCAVMFGFTVNNLNFIGNTISSNDKLCISFNNVTVNNGNIKDNILVASRNTAIGGNGTYVLNNCNFENTFSTTYQLIVRNGSTLNGKTYTADSTRAVFGKSTRLSASIATFDVPANSTVRKFLHKVTDLGLTSDYVLDSNSLFLISPNGTVPNSLAINLYYSDASNLKACFTNTSDATITVPTIGYTIRIDE